MSKTILIVDDDLQVRDLLKSFLESHGFTVVTSSDGWDGIRELMVNKPDLIVLDINMPKMDGLETLDLMKSGNLREGIPLIVTSAAGDRDTILHVRELGADDFLVKPFSFTELTRRITELLTA